MKIKLDNSQIEKLLIFVCVVILIAYFIPYFVLGENFPVLIHDNLDSNVVWTKLLLENNHFFSYKDNFVPQVMNANTQLSYSGDISFLFFMVFGMYWGYVANKIVMALIAFVGMYMLLKKHIIHGNQNTLIHYLVALSFSILPFWSFTLSIAGLPLALYAILNIRQKQIQWYNFAILVVFAFYSSLLLVGIFFLAVIALIWFIDCIKEKKANIPFLISIAVLTIAYAISHFPLFYSFFFPAIDVSHRVEFKTEYVSFSQAYDSFVDIFLNGQYHAPTLHKKMFPAILIALFLIRTNWKAYQKMYLTLFFLLASSIFYGFMYWGKVGMLITKITEIVPVQLQRFHFLQPLGWFIVFAIALSIINSKMKFGKIATLVFIAVEFFFVIRNHEYIINKHNPSYASFYSEDLFSQIKQNIGKETSSYRVISVGLHPSIAQYNGFYTLDSYIASYPLKYKHQFRKIIAPELNKSEVLTNYFDNWGSRCYAFSSELGTELLFSKKENKTINQLDFDFIQLKKMGGKYILSAVEINTNHNKDLRLKNVFSTNNSYWKIFLYELKN